MLETITRRALHHIYAILLALNSYPQERIDAFCQAHLLALKNDPSTPAKILMISDFEAVLDPFYLGITVKHSDLGQRKTAIKVIKNKKTFIIDELSDLVTKINTITNNNSDIITEFGLNDFYSFYTGKDFDILRRFAELKYNITAKAILSTLVVQATTLETTIGLLYTTKHDKKDDVRLDISILLPLVDPIGKAMILNFCALHKDNIDNLDAIRRYYPVELMDLDTNDPNFLRKNQWLVELAAMQIINDPRIIFKFTDSLKIQSYLTGDAMVFLSDTPNPTEIPSRAILISAGQTVEFPIENIGSATELYLIFAAVTAGEFVRLKVSVI
jgi:hypothetical protein